MDAYNTKHDLSSLTLELLKKSMRIYMFFLHKQVIILNHQAKPITTIRFISHSVISKS